MLRVAEGGEYENKYVVRMETAQLNVENAELRDHFSNGWRDQLVPVSVMRRGGTGACRRAVGTRALCVCGDRVPCLRDSSDFGCLEKAS